jgi:SDR family mycofactocin-dependent oxidoreductase
MEAGAGKLDGKVTLITGGARGQGRSHALTLAGEGADIVIVDNCIVDVAYQMYPGGTTQQLEETQRLVEAKGRRCIAIIGDVRNIQDLQDAAARAVSDLGGLDIAVANAGIAPALNKLGDVDPECWDLVIDINLTGVYNTIRAVLPEMISKQSGRIIATSSMAGRAGYPNAGPYCASKWGVIGLIKAVAGDYGPFGITANAVCPTNVNSPMIHNDNTYSHFAPDLEHPTRQQVEERMKMAHPLGVPYVEPEDVSQAILFLASDAARYISGEALTVSAGMIARNAA